MRTLAYGCARFQNFMREGRKTTSPDNGVKAHENDSRASSRPHRGARRTRAKRGESADLQRRERARRWRLAVTRAWLPLPLIARLGGWAVGRLGGWAVGRLGGWAVGRYHYAHGGLRQRGRWSAQVCGAAERCADRRPTVTETSMSWSSFARIFISRSTVKRPMSALRMREKSAAGV